jgi:hypothetical protein
MSQTKAQLIAGTSSQDVIFDDATVNSLNGGPLAGARNRIINGDMRIDQRNAGASVTVNSTSPFYAVDRFSVEGQSADGVLTIQRDSTAPAGFSNSLKVTVTTADASVGASQRYQLNQKIEGFNVADFGFGTANARATTLSFWVRSSLIGTFGGSYRNNAANRSYPFSYTISAANTWEYKSISIAGDTSGTWLADSGSGLHVAWSLGSGTNFQGAAGSWNSNNNNTVTGETQLIATNGATFYITGVQLEAGTVATPFERRSYGQELALCQRYFNRITQGATGSAVSSTNCHLSFAAGVPMRALPNASLSAAAKLDFPFVANYTQSSVDIATSFSSQNCGYNFGLGNFTGLTTHSRLVLRDDGGAISLSAEL